MDLGAMRPIRTGSDWTETAETVSDDDGSLINLNDLGATVEIQVRNDRGVVLSGSSTDGRIEVGPGYVTWTFRASEMSRLCRGPYQVHVRVKVDSDTQWLFSSDLSVLDGGFR